MSAPICAGQGFCFNLLIFLFLIFILVLTLDVLDEEGPEGSGLSFLDWLLFLSTGYSSCAWVNLDVLADAV